MPLTRCFLHNRLAWVAALLAVAGLAGPAFSQGYRGDPVEALRAALKTPVLESSREELDSRRNLLAKRIDDLRNVGDLRRALLLDAWQDEEANRQATEIDREVAGADRSSPAATASGQHGTWRCNGPHGGRYHDRGDGNDDPRQRPERLCPHLHAGSREAPE